ncbi:hypothetical protein LEMLEM_LOCUS6898 [Lemmus lemmus]
MYAGQRQLACPISLYKGTQGSQDSDGPLEAGVTGFCELSNMGVGF